MVGVGLVSCETGVSDAVFTMAGIFDFVLRASDERHKPDTGVFFGIESEPMTLEVGEVDALAAAGFDSSSNVFILSFVG